MALRRWFREHPSMGPYLCMVVLLMIGYAGFSDLVNERSSERRRVDRQTCEAAQSALTAVARLERSIEGIVAPILESTSDDPEVRAFRDRTRRELQAARDAIAEARQDCGELPEP